MIGVEQVFGNKTAAERSTIVGHFLELVGLGDAMDKRPAELSQGMRQRVGLARAFALSPKMLLLDEPFGMLDSLTRYELQEVLVDLLVKNRTTALMVTHDVDEALFLSDRIVMMTSGPAATVGGVLDVSFTRPRVRREVFGDANYYPLRERLIGFLADQAKPDEPRESEPTEKALVSSLPADAVVDVEPRDPGHHNVATLNSDGNALATLQSIS
jgi:ABC-type nitrate/sulfonate/bicarbonate transport system ATPase subunit